MTTQGQEQQRQRSPIDDIRANLEKMGGQFKAVMPTQDHVNRFIRVVMTAVQSNVDLLEADRASFYAACMRCAQEGLLPDGKQAVLKIYNTKVGRGNDERWVKMAAYEPMTEGMLIKLRNSGEVIGAPKVHVVFEGDEFNYELGDNEHIMHKPKPGAPTRKIIAAYSIVKLKSGDTSREVMWAEEIDSIMARTKSKDKDGNIFGPWKTDKPEMARKTVFKRHAKRLPKSTDLDNLINRDNEENGLADIVQPQQQRAALPAPGQAGGTPMPQNSAARPASYERVINESGGDPEGGQQQSQAGAQGGQQGKQEGERKGPPDDII